MRQLYEQLQESKRELSLTPKNIQAVVETALEAGETATIATRHAARPARQLSAYRGFRCARLEGSWAQVQEWTVNIRYTRNRTPDCF